MNDTLKSLLRSKPSTALEKEKILAANKVAACQMLLKIQASLNQSSVVSATTVAKKG